MKWSKFSLGIWVKTNVCAVSIIFSQNMALLRLLLFQALTTNKVLSEKILHLIDRLFDSDIKYSWNFIDNKP